jgi:predicted TIM-barrel fold metal-dependent hydrolase
VATFDQLKEMAKKGAFIEYTIGAYTAAQMIPLTHYYVETEYSSVDEGMSKTAVGGIRHVAEAVLEIGPDKCIMSTDFGRYALSTPVEGLRQYIACMLDLGISPDDIQKMVSTNPARLLGLD